MSPVIKTSRHSLVAPPFVSRLFISFLYVYTIVYFGWSHFPFGCVGLAGASQRDHFDTIRWWVWDMECKQIYTNLSYGIITCQISRIGARKIW